MKNAKSVIMTVIVKKTAKNALMMFVLVVNVVGVIVNV
tara:strand:- start:410 stop:523 length:114 start_codon:yes stop_codon:yes gene_type:complete